jgi:hypothetical protein
MPQTTGYASLQYNIKFTANGNSYSRIAAYKYANNGGLALAYGYTPVYQTRTGAWTNTLIREIFISGGADATNTDLIEWLESTSDLIDRYYVDKSDLSSVADAIRAKGGTTDPLTFPDGWVTAIENINPPIPSNYGRIEYDGSILTVS